MNNIQNPRYNFEDSVGTMDEFSHVTTVNIESKFTIKVPVNFQKKIEYLHVRFPGKEWSGFGFAKYSQAKINHYLVVELVDFYPLHLGTSSFTSFEQTEEFAGFMADNLDYMQYKLVYVHTHHSMGAFHSGTDTNTLKRLTVTGNNVLFLVVDTRNTWWGHIAVLVETHIEHSKKLITTHGYDINNNKISYNLNPDKEALKSTTEIQKTILLHKGVMEFEQYEDSLGNFTVLADKIEENRRIEDTNNNNWRRTPAPVPAHNIGVRNSGGQFNLFEGPRSVNISQPVTVGGFRSTNSTQTLDEDYLLKEVDIYNGRVLLFGISYITILFIKAIFDPNLNFLTTKLEENSLKAIRRSWIDYLFSDFSSRFAYEDQIAKLVEKLGSRTPDYFSIVLMEIESLSEELSEQTGREDEWYILQDISEALNELDCATRDSE